MRPKKNPNPKKLGNNINFGMNFENFIIGPSNMDIANLCQNFAQKDSELPFQSLYFYGSVGVGKTHILNAMAQRMMAEGAKILLITAKDFVENFVQSVMNKDIHQFKQYFAAIDMILIDDVHFIVGKEGSIAILEQIFDQAMDCQCKIAFAGNAPVHEYPKMGTRMVSRLNGGMMVQIPPLDGPTRFNILKYKAA